MYELFYSAGLTNFSYQLSVEVSLVTKVTMPPKRTTECFLSAPPERSCQHIEIETAANEGEVGGGLIKILGWGADKNVMSRFIFSAPPPLPTFYFAPQPQLNPFCAYPPSCALKGASSSKRPREVVQNIPSHRENCKVATFLVTDGAPAVGNLQMTCSKANRIIVLPKRY